MKIIYSFLFVCFLAIAALPFAQAQERYTSLSLYSDHAVIVPGQTFYVAVEQNIAPHWHTYWKNAGDSGEPMSVHWSLPEGFSPGKIRWPAPKQIPAGPLMNFGYEDSAFVIQPITAPNNLTPGQNIRLKADIEILVCKEICIPEFDTVELTIKSGSIKQYADTTTLNKFEAAQRAYPIIRNWPAIFETSDNNAATLRFTPGENGKTLLQNSSNILFFPLEWGVIDHAASQTFNGFNGDEASLTLQAGDRDISQLDTISGVLTFINQDGEKRSFTINASYKTNSASAVTNNISTKTVTDKKIAQIIVFALLGGLILNLMPCVFPVLSMKALSLIKMSDKGHAHARMHGLSYTAGILFSFMIVAGGLIALKSAGAQIGWGFQLQNPAIVLILSYILFIIGLNLSGVFEFSGKLANTGHKFASGNGLKGSFFTGMLATVVATPCTAPFMGVALGFALTQPPFISLVVFAALGLGLALPYLLLSFIPALRNFLPKPGAWMESFRNFLAFPMYGSAAWLIWVYSQQTGSTGLMAGLAGLVIIGLALWIIKFSRIAAMLVLLFGFAAPAYIGLNDHKNYQAAAKNVLEIPYSQQSYSEALNSGAPLFVNMTAAWCITCKVNEKVALSVASTRALFAERGITYMKGDWTNQDPKITQYLNKYGRQGVPLYVYYGALDPKTGQRPDPVVLPQLLTPQIVKTKIEETIL